MVPSRPLQLCNEANQVWFQQKEAEPSHWYWCATTCLSLAIGICKCTGMLFMWEMESLHVDMESVYIQFLVLPILPPLV